MKKPTFRRILAFIIDMMIVSIISSAIASIGFINPTLDKYNEAYDSYTEYLQNGLDTKNVSNILNSEEYKDITYNINYYGRYGTIITLVVTVIYFVVFQYFTNGYTGGKKLLNIKIESEDGKLKVHQLLLRSLIINNVLTTTLALIALFVLSKGTFAKVGNYIDVLEMGLVFASFALVLYRQDGKGLHDLLAKTKVVLVNKTKE